MEHSIIFLHLVRKTFSHNFQYYLVIYYLVIIKARTLKQLVIKCFSNLF